MEIVDIMSNKTKLAVRLQDNATFWKAWDFFVSARGMFGFRAKDGTLREAQEAVGPLVFLATLEPRVG